MRKTLVAFVLLTGACAAAAQAYPTRVVRYVVSDAPGSGLDTLARIIAEGLTAHWGHQVVVDNRPGAGGNIGAEVLARATTDGYTIGQIATTHAVNATFGWIGVLYAGRLAARLFGPWSGVLAMVLLVVGLQMLRRMYG